MSHNLNPHILDRHYLKRLFRLALSFFIAISALTTTSEEHSPDDCYKNKDNTCLEESFADSATNPSPEKTRAMYLLGLLKQEAGETEGAKEAYMMALGFGATDEVQQALNELYATNPNAFTKPTDCLAVESEVCFKSIIENGQGNTVRNAQFLLAGLLMNEQPSRSAELLESAYAAGHRTAACSLQELYGKGAGTLDANYDKSVTYGLDCAFQPPFRNLDKKHFAKYQRQSDNKAYALADNGIAWYVEGISDPAIAARLAKEYCDTSPQRRSNDPECSVVNVNGTWVKDPKLSQIPDFTGSVDDLISVKAQESYKTNYVKDTGLKVFAQSKDGSWNWRSSKDPEKSIESLTEDVLKKCGQNWRKRLGYPCKVVNINGDWVN